MRVAIVIGTRPEAIKVAPVILAMKEDPLFDVRVIVTAQHREMLDQVLRVFDIKPDIDLDIMRPNQSLPELTSRILQKMDELLRELRPDAVLAQGDTTTVMATALACFYLRIPFCHLEAGLRSNDLWNPYPEEFNRIVAGRLARLHFAPTVGAQNNLLKEGVAPNQVVVTGNTVIDALFYVTQQNFPLTEIKLDDRKRLVLLTTHRRENFGEPLRATFAAVRELVDRFDDIEVLYPVHPNPNVSGPAQEMLAGHSRIHLVAPLSYEKFCAAMKRAYLVLTDSGGVQEEAPALGKPVLVLREVTERPEAIDAGVSKLVGTQTSRIVAEVAKLLDDACEYEKMAKGVSPYGDGYASQRVIAALKSLPI